MALPTDEGQIDRRADFRATMAHLAAPVAVVTTMNDLKPFGTTISAFISLSMAPPMMLVSLARESETLAQIRRSGRFGLNILSKEQSGIATRFAGKGGADKFTGTGMDWCIDDSVPHLGHTAGWVACEVDVITDGGDHCIVLGSVVAAKRYLAEPLTYRDRTFGTHAALQQV